jgi:hypothetical protein
MSTIKIEPPWVPDLTNYHEFYWDDGGIWNSLEEISAALDELKAWSIHNYKCHETAEFAPNGYRDECRAYIAANVETLIACYPNRSQKQSKIYKTVLIEDLLNFTPDIIREVFTTIRRTETGLPSIAAIYSFAEKIKGVRKEHFKTLSKLKIEATRVELEREKRAEREVEQTENGSAARIKNGNITEK